MRVLAIIVLLASLAAPACDPDPSPACVEAYDHLIGLASHAADPDQRDRFVAACVAAWDEGRHACLLAATTADEALACRPTHIRPG